MESTYSIIGHDKVENRKGHDNFLNRQIKERKCFNNLKYILLLNNFQYFKICAFTERAILQFQKRFILVCFFHILNLKI